MKYAAEAAYQITRFAEHYEAKGRVEAVVALGRAMAKAEALINTAPLAGLSAPRPYPALARAGGFWIKAGRYWFRYTLGPPVVILNVFFEAANIPGRMGEFTPLGS